MRKSGTLYHKMREESNAAAEICSADEKLNGEAHVIQIEGNGNGNGNGEAHVIKIEGNGNYNGDTHINEIERKGSCDDELLGQPPVKSTFDSAEDVKEIHNEDTKVSDDDHIIAIHRKGSKNNSKELIQATTVTDVQGDEKTRELVSGGKISKKKNFRAKFKGLNKMLEELFAPPTIAAIIGLFVGAIPWLKKLIIGASAPLRVIEDTISTLGNALLPCTILILGGNLTQGIKKSTLKPLVVIVILVVRYVLLPIAGIGVVKAAGHLGFLPHDPLYRYVLMIQFALPPAMSIGTMAQLFDIAKEECSVIFLWTYLAAMLALTIWPTIFMSILS